MAVPTPYGAPSRSEASSIPPALAEPLRNELEEVADEVVQAIIEHSPGYAGPSTRKLRSVAVEALTLFVDLIADPRSQGDAAPAMYHELGRAVARQDRSLDGLQSALRVGGMQAWRRLNRTAEGLGLGSAVVSALGELALRTAHEVAEAAARGYAEEQLRGSDELERRRRRLIGLLLGEGPVSPEAVHDLAHAARWPVPRQVAVVALASSPGIREETWPLTTSDVLVDMESRPPRMLVPDPHDQSHFTGRTFTLALRDRPAAIGPTVSLTQASRSLLWATRALGLMGRGILPRQGVVRCVDHLSTLLLHSDEPLLDELRSHVLAPLDTVPEGQRARHAETLLAWLLSGSNVPDVANRLHLHPQTVRYRLRQLKPLFGDALDDPDTRLELILALRAESLREPESSSR
ncbi:PucR family transcriptional regulator [Streptomyces sp. SID13726]|uniref:PucR family transcriptional regulator n=1 Tax=Streptomyces sp. SID13726 TaxID=2706058 RepID=UPI0013B9967F|nr:PucR family transcriptional regulator [Streptomyces sp. SID13726]NEA98963.1 PucR family transcriptional regulator [Streptomyces sp. SID13726]